MLTLPLIVCAVALQWPDPKSLDWRIEQSDWIVLARVVATPTVKGQGTELAELSIERVLFGPEPERAFAVAWETKERTRKGGLDAGQSYVLFLSSCPGGIAARKGNERNAENALQGAPLYMFQADAAWRLVESDKVLVPYAFVPLEGRPPGMEPGAEGALVPRDALLDWLASRIDASLPSIRASIDDVLSTSVFVAPDGTVHGPDDSTSRLEPARWRELWSTLDQERFWDLPQWVGSSEGPCAMPRSLEVRTRQGRKEVIIVGDFLEFLSPSERDAAERALRIWRAMPLKKAL